MYGRVWVLITIPLAIPNPSLLNTNIPRNNELWPHEKKLRKHGKYGHFRRPILKEIKSGSSARLLLLMQKLDKSGRESNAIRQAIHEELTKRDKGKGGPYGNWEHG